MQRLTLQTATKRYVASRAVASVRPRCLLSTTAAPRKGNDNATSTSTDDSFRVLGLDHDFGIDMMMLKTSYMKLMTDYHPDKHTLKDAAEQVAVEHQAASVTNAYDVLKRPHTRATHLLEVLGHPMEEGSTGELVGMEFLMQIMTLREQIDSTDSDEALKPLLTGNVLRMNETAEQLVDAFDERDIKRAMELTAQLQYWHRIDETIREKMSSLE